MTADFVPQSYANLLLWLQNLATKFNARGAALGFTAAEVTAIVAQINALAYKVQAVLAAQTALDMAVADFQQAQKSPTAGMTPLRASIARAKKAPGYTQAIGEEMEVIGAEINVDPDTYKPTMTAEAMPGHVRIKGRKKGIQMMNIYRRLKGQTTWALVAGNRSKFPFDDDAPLAQPGVPENREYSVIGTKADAEIGQRSDIVAVTYGG